MKEWKPFPKQEIALNFDHKDAFEILFGGARGPGKTDTGMVWLLGEEYEEGKLYIEHPRYRALVLRKNYEDLNDWLDRAGNMYRRYGAEVVGKPAEIRFPSGALFRCGHLRDAKSYEKYLGHEYQRELVEELTQIPEEKHFVQIMGSCRSTITELRPQVFATTNPGGPGHMWVKERYIDPGEPMKPFDEVKIEEGETIKIRPRVFIPSTLDDNPILLEKDPGYVQYLDSIKETDEDLYRAWRYGDWDVFAGQVFSEFRRAKHVIPPVVPKMGFKHILSIDWGFSPKHDTTFSAYASAVIPMKTEDGEVFNRVITYKEWCGNQKEPYQWAETIYNQMPWRFNSGVVDPNMHNPRSDGSTPIKDLFEQRWRELNDEEFWLSLDRGGNNRIEGVATVHNWLSIAPDGQPYWMITENCKHLIRTLPMLVYDDNRIEDVDTKMEDHPYDAIRYALGSVNFISASEGSIRRGGKPTHSYPIMVEVKDDKVENVIDLDDFAKHVPRKKGGRHVV